MSVVQMRPSSTQNYSIFRRGQVARAMFDRISSQYKSLFNDLNASTFVNKVEIALANCPASSLVGNSWDDIVQKCVHYLMAKPHNFEEEDLKMRLYVRLLQSEQYA